ncbi:hypothetical protein MGG_16192 [Pyricularia oryzae 70-15]|uniref:Uncharacterized protein n=1 Tax=Pyricularia oryzae (strain 70-15 / ATCC MYA-4617 / FGSC 8958) TaxID=242507 RepID=G4MMJ0_PYRO7|nr:uncharacterized protein MGG_16192 [Pyricularia oryzae 70-15]EHA56968.1 hypothetical protein MGG_16192 [Pyricularia oryzae 70-15]
MEENLQAHLARISVSERVSHCSITFRALFSHSAKVNIPLFPTTRNCRPKQPYAGHTARSSPFFRPHVHIKQMKNLQTIISRIRGRRLPIGSRLLEWWMVQKRDDGRSLWLPTGWRRYVPLLQDTSHTVRHQPVASQHNSTGDRAKLGHVRAHLNVSC